ncbi:MAG: flagellar biosynthetic protein FliR [Aureliella sp.]
MDLSAELIASIGTHSEWCCVFAAVFCRIAPFLFMMPGVGSLVLPVRFRIAFACTLSLLLVPLTRSDATSGVHHLTLQALPAFAGELMLGVMLGTIFSLIVVSLQLAGRVVSQLAGFDFAQSTSAGDVDQQPLLAGMFGWLAVVVLFSCGGHRLILDACMSSFIQYPLGTVGIDGSWLESLVRALQHSCDVGLRAALPVSFALLVANLVNGIVARTVPQMNLFALGFSLNALTLLAALAISVGGVGWVFQREIGGWISEAEKVAPVDP